MSMEKKKNVLEAEATRRNEIQLTWSHETLKLVADLLDASKRVIMKEHAAAKVTLQALKSVRTELTAKESELETVRRALEAHVNESLANTKVNESKWEAERQEGQLQLQQAAEDLGELQTPFDACQLQLQRVETENITKQQQNDQLQNKLTEQENYVAGRLQNIREMLTELANTRNRVHVLTDELGKKWEDERTTATTTSMPKGDSGLNKVFEQQSSEMGRDNDMATESADGEEEDERGLKRQRTWR